MMYFELLQVVNKLAKLSEEGEHLFREVFKPKTLKKNDYFLKSGQRNNKAAFIKSGLVRYFVIKNEEESTLEFTKELEFIADYPGFINQGMSITSIQAIEDCELLVVSYDGLQRIYNELANGDRIGRMVLEHRFSTMMIQIFSIYMGNAEQRYKFFIENYGELAQRIPQYLIASYVGIKPESLSRIKNKIVNRNS